MNNNQDRGAGDRESITRYERVDAAVGAWMRAHGLTALRISMGIVFLWFGGLKLFPGVSPAEGLAVDTITTLTFGMFPPAVIRVGLAVWEVLIGLGFLYGKAMRVTLVLLFLQMPGTFTPIFIFPELVFQSVPFILTIEGQYIFKNFILIAAGIMLGGYLEQNPWGGVRKPE